MGEDFGVREFLKKIPSADPVLSSRILTPEEDTELSTVAPETHHGQLVKLSDGTRLFRVDYENEEGEETAPATQQAVALLLKSIVNVADVISVDVGDDKYHFSYALPLDMIGKAKEGSIGIQQIFLDALFGDYDHPVIFTTEEGKVVPMNHANIIFGEDQSQFYYFDFHLAFEEAFLTGRAYSQDFARSHVDWIKVDKERIEPFRTLLTRFRERLEGKEGLEFIRAVVSKTGTSMKELFARSALTNLEAFVRGGHGRYFQQEMLRRIDFMLKYLDVPRAQRSIYDS